MYLQNRPMKETYSRVRHESFAAPASFLCVCDVTYSDVRCATYICAIWLIHSCNTTYCMRDMSHLQHLPLSFVCVTQRIQMCDVPHTYVRYDAFIHVIRLTLCATCSTWLIHLCDMTYAHVQQYVFVILASFICVTRLIHSCNTTYSMRDMFDMTHLFMWHDVFTCATICMGDTAFFVCVTWRIHSCNTTYSMRDMTHSFMRHNLFICATICMGDTWISHVTWMNESCRTSRA